MIKLNNYFFYLYSTILVLCVSIHAMEVEQKTSSNRVFLTACSKLQSLFEKHPIELDTYTVALIAKRNIFIDELTESTKERLGNIQQESEKVFFSWKDFSSILNKITVGYDRRKCILTGKSKLYIQSEMKCLSPCCRVDGIIDAIHLINDWQEYIDMSNEEDSKLAPIMLNNSKKIKRSKSYRACEATLVKIALSEACKLLNIPYKDNDELKKVLITKENKQSYYNLLKKQWGVQEIYEAVGIIENIDRSTRSQKK